MVNADSENRHTVFSDLDRRLYITHVDDVSTNNFCFNWPDCHAQEVRVAPGRRYLKLRYAHLNGFAVGTVWLDADAGRKYVVRKRISGYALQFWVEDATTGRTVGGIPGAEEERK